MVSHQAAPASLARLVLPSAQDLHLPPLVLRSHDGHLEEPEVELDSRGGVVITRNGVGDQGWVAVRVYHAHCGDVHLSCVPDGHVGLKDIGEGVGEDDQVRQADTQPILDIGIGHQAALPVASVSIFAAFLGGGLYPVGKLTVPADEEDYAFAVGDVSHEVESKLEVYHRLFQVDDVLIETAPKNVWLHESAGDKRPNMSSGGDWFLVFIKPWET